MVFSFRETVCHAGRKAVVDWADKAVLPVLPVAVYQWLCRSVTKAALRERAYHCPKALLYIGQVLKRTAKGELAQLVERVHGMDEVSGSSPLFSTCKARL